MFMPSSSGISTGFPPGLLGSVCRMRTEGPDEASKAMWRGQAKERGQSCLQLRATIAQQTTDEFLGKFKLHPAAHSMSRGKADPQRKGFRPRKEDCISVSSESDPLNSLLARRPHRPAPALIVEEQKISSEGSEPPAAGGLDTGLLREALVPATQANWPVKTRRIYHDLTGASQWRASKGVGERAPG
ncbi:hypothetical protein MPTK2_8g15870 [Marchantia polymorpha subsp. ruderalis]